MATLYFQGFRYVQKRCVTLTLMRSAAVIPAVNKQASSPIKEAVPLVLLHQTLLLSTNS